MTDSEYLLKECDRLAHKVARAATNERHAWERYENPANNGEQFRDYHEIWHRSLVVLRGLSRNYEEAQRRAQAEATA